MLPLRGISTFVRLKRELKGQTGVGRVPFAVAVGRHYAKAVASWRNVGVIGDAAGPHFDPIVIEPLQLVLEFHLLRHGKAGRGVVKFQFAFARGLGNGLVHIHLLAINYDLLDHRPGHQTVSRYVVGINHYDSGIGGNPQFAVPGLADVRSGTAEYSSSYAIRTAISGGTERGNFSVRDGFQLFFVDAGNAFLAAQPEVAIAVFVKIHNVVFQESLPAGDYSKLAIFQAIDAGAHGANPQDSLLV